MLIKCVSVLPLKIHCFILLFTFIILQICKPCWCQTSTASPANASGETPPKLLVVVIDGLRWDFINTSHASEGPCAEGASCVAEGSFFTTVQQEGATASWMAPVFPTTTAPNILTMATGQLPVDHGVLGEPWQDGEWNLSTSASPVWQTAAEHGFKTALLRWLDCGVLQYNGDHLSCISRVELAGTDNLLVQLNGDAALAADMFINEKFSVVFMRTEIISWTARHFGVNGTLTREVMRELELVLDELFAELKKAGLWQQLNVVLTSGSGLSVTDPSTLKEVSVSRCLWSKSDKLTARYSSTGSILLAPSSGLTADQVMKELDNCTSDDKGALQSYKISDLPPVDQWPGGPEELLVVANPGNWLEWDPKSRMVNSSAVIFPDDADFGRGELAGDGFSVLDSDMNGVFIVKGSGESYNILRGVTGPSVSCPDVHALLQYMLVSPPEQELLRGGVEDQQSWEEIMWMVDISISNVVEIYQPMLVSVMLLLQAHYLFHTL